MATAKSMEEQYLTEIEGKGIWVNTMDHGIKPYDLLEAALASCMNITARMWMDKYNISCGSLQTEVKLDKLTNTFKYSYQVDCQLDQEQKVRLERVLAQCPVKKILSQDIKFELSGN